MVNTACFQFFGDTPWHMQRLKSVKINWRNCGMRLLSIKLWILMPSAEWFFKRFLFSQNSELVIGIKSEGLFGLLICLGPLIRARVLDSLNLTISSSTFLCKFSSISSLCPANLAFKISGKKFALSQFVVISLLLWYRHGIWLNPGNSKLTRFDYSLIFF